MAGRTVSGVLQTGQGTLFIGMAPCEVLAAQRIQGVASLVGVGAFTCGACHSQLYRFLDQLELRGHQLERQVPKSPKIPHLRLLGWLLWAYSRCGVSTGVLIGLCAASLRGLATVSRQLWSLSG